MNEDTRGTRVLLEGAAEGFARLTGMGHQAISGGVTHIQPHVYLEMHLLQMWAAGWQDVDFDTLAAVSGASALFAYERGSFMGKYAFLMAGPDDRIAEATGFGYEWVPFQGVEGAFAVIRDSVDTGRPAKGWDWEARLFAGYQDAPAPSDREVFVMADGPDTSAEWHNWEELTEWVDLVAGWSHTQLGRHTGRVPQLPARDVALRVVRDLVASSRTPPHEMARHFPGAAFGLAGIKAYAADCADPAVELTEGWLACHAINPQWTMRSSSGVYLERAIDAGLFPDDAGRCLRNAAAQYRGAFAAWQEFYEILGHQAPAEARQSSERRQAGAAQVRRWLEAETAAIAHLERALAALGGL